MPAIGTRAAEARTRTLRLVGLAVALLFLASAGATFSGPAQGKDWTPQIQTTRRAQVYWESVMRAADAEIRGLKRSQKQAQRKLGRIKANRERALEKRATAKRRLKEAKVGLAVARDRLEAASVASPPPPDASTALATLVAPPLVIVPTTDSPIGASAMLAPLGVAAGKEPVTVEAASDREAVDGRVVRKLEKDAKTAKRSFQKAKRKAQRSARNTRSAAARLRALRQAESGAVARRESAERSLGAWILAMTKYGRIRATKKSDARPGVNSAFAWPVRGRISQYFHAGHDGIDIVRYRGAPVRSAAFGVVTYVGWNPWDQHGRAFMVVVTHAGGYETLYGHLLPRRIVRVGEEVRKGQVVGYMGSTGNSTGPHLHLELRRGRTTINPLGFL